MSEADTSITSFSQRKLHASQWARDANTPVIYLNRKWIMTFFFGGIGV
jgi:hypothetical protein